MVNHATFRHELCGFRGIYLYPLNSHAPRLRCVIVRSTPCYLWTAGIFTLRAYSYYIKTMHLFFSKWKKNYFILSKIENKEKRKERQFLMMIWYQEVLDQKWQSAVNGSWNIPFDTPPTVGYLLPLRGPLIGILTPKSTWIRLTLSASPKLTENKPQEGLSSYQPRGAHRFFFKHLRRHQLL